MADMNATGAAGATEPTLLDHDADGIREYDNPMPFWWSTILWGSVVFSALYALYYMVGVGPGHAEEFDGELSGFYQEQAARLGDLQPDDGTMASLMADPRMMARAVSRMRLPWTAVAGSRLRPFRTMESTRSAMQSIQVEAPVTRAANSAVVVEGKVGPLEVRSRCTW